LDNARKLWKKVHISLVEAARRLWFPAPAMSLVLSTSVQTFTVLDSFDLTARNNFGPLSQFFGFLRVIQVEAEKALALWRSRF